MTQVEAEKILTYATVALAFTRSIALRIPAQTD